MGSKLTCKSNRKISKTKKGKLKHGHKKKTLYYLIYTTSIPKNGVLLLHSCMIEIKINVCTAIEGSTWRVTTERYGQVRKMRQLKN
jgi:hypothetical protein